MIKILFLIHDLGSGGAEKVLVNLVNNMNYEVFDITVMALFKGGANEKLLNSQVRYQYVYKRVLPGNSHLMKLLTPKALHKKYIKERYDIEVSYLEGPSAGIISGCPFSDTKLVTWIHSNLKTHDQLAASFRSKKEALDCYRKFDEIVCVSQTIENDLRSLFDDQIKTCVLYNTVESDVIMEKSQEEVTFNNDGCVNLISVGTLKEVKGYLRLLSIMKRLRDESYPIHLFIAGDGPLRSQMQDYIKQHALDDTVTLLGYQTNPYKYVAKADLYVCSSYSEGFSTAVTEALIVGTPVCTVDVSGMHELLGENEFGLITDNSEEALYEGIKKMLDEPDLLLYYKTQSIKRGKAFRTEMTVRAVEEMFFSFID